MGHFNDARIAVENYINERWTHSPIHFWFSNVPFDDAGEAHIAVQVEEFDAEQITLGGGPQTHRHYGTITVQVFTVEGEGAAQADQFCDYLDPLFRRAEITYGDSGVIVCRTPQKRTVGVREGWYQVNMSIPYKRDVHH